MQPAFDGNVNQQQALMLQMQQMMQMQQHMGARQFAAFPVPGSQVLPGMMPQPYMPTVGPSMQMGMPMMGMPPRMMGQTLMPQPGMMPAMM